ncbi:4-oxalocrotonate tautomerase family protein [Nonomuraea sp. NBC_00507]|uniref:tautomerase family protein n=1 Tax=Nonomuraea sp. NBC_00507 TaxID=2976002 RepID=UPI002E16FBA2
MRTAEQKREISRRVSEALVSVAKAAPGTVQVLFRMARPHDQYFNPSDLVAAFYPAAGNAEVTFRSRVQVRKRISGITYCVPAVCGRAGQ